MTLTQAEDLKLRKYGATCAKQGADFTPMIFHT